MGIDHEVLELFILAHAERLKTVASPPLPHQQLITSFIQVETGSEAVAFSATDSSRITKHLGCHSPARQQCFSRDSEGNFFFQRWQWA